MKNKSVDFDLTKNPITNTTYKKTNPFPKELLQLDEARIKAFM